MLMTWVLHGLPSSLHGPAFLLVPTVFPPGGFTLQVHTAPSLHLPLFLEETFLHTLVIYICFHVNELYSHSKATHPLPMTRGTVIHFPSSDGMSRSGVFITCMSEIERVKVEGGVDIFQTVKAARAQRPHMVYSAVSYY